MKPAAQNIVRSIAVIFENDSGLGDIGKHVIAQANQQGISVRAISTDPGGLTTCASITPVEVPNEKLLQRVTVDIEHYSGSEKETLETAIEGVDAVVHCGSNRQFNGSHPRHALLWTQAVTDAMIAKQVRNTAGCCVTYFMTLVFIYTPLSTHTYTQVPLCLIQQHNVNLTASHNHHKHNINQI